MGVSLQACSMLSIPTSTLEDDELACLSKHTRVADSIAPSLGGNQFPFFVQDLAYRFQGAPQLSIDSAQLKGPASGIPIA
jgi:hypothetical protein